VQREWVTHEMNAFDLIKATVVCGGLAFLVYSFPLISQIVVIGLLGFVWGFYAYKVASAFSGKAG
jgi:hypothetical protein